MTMRIWENLDEREKGSRNWEVIARDIHNHEFFLFLFLFVVLCMEVVEGIDGFMQDDLRVRLGRKVIMKGRREEKWPLAR